MKPKRRVRIVIEAQTYAILKAVRENFGAIIECPEYFYMVPFKVLSVTASIIKGDK